LLGFQVQKVEVPLVEMYTELEQNSHLQDKGEKDDEHRGEEDSAEGRIPYSCLPIGTLHLLKQETEVRKE